ncbi:hypothetical protein Lal_00024921 [Lupinus albus]|nr:hypothetical protein Lal_00024921 [Lupinus albus]
MVLPIIGSRMRSLLHGGAYSFLGATTRGFNKGLECVGNLDLFDLMQKRAKAATVHLSFDQQCRFCEKESINQSLLNILRYPWIEHTQLLSLHGGYYNFLTCSFEKWTLDFKECNDFIQV